MQLTARIKNKSTIWAANQRPRVGDVVTDGSIYYSNLTGYNDVLSNFNVWMPISTATSSSIPVITLTASNVSGTDPFFYIDLSAQTSIPALPRTFTVYVDLNGSGDFQKMDPVSYDPSTKILSNVPSKTDYPGEIFKIFVS